MAGKATIMITTTLRKGVFTWAKKIAILKPGDKINVIEYRSDWYCKCKHEKYGEGYCIYFADPAESDVLYSRLYAFWSNPLLFPGTC